MENKNQPAFPLSAEAEERIRGGYGFMEIGLTKREYFIATVLKGLCANPNWTKNLIQDDWDDYTKRLTEGSIEIADEILKKL